MDLQNHNTHQILETPQRLYLSIYHILGTQGTFTTTIKDKNGSQCVKNKAPKKPHIAPLWATKKNKATWWKISWRVLLFDLFSTKFSRFLLFLLMGDSWPIASKYGYIYLHLVDFYGITWSAIYYASTLFCLSMHQKPRGDSLSYKWEMFFRLLPPS